MVKANETREDEGAHSEVELGVGVQVALEKARQGNAMQWIWHHDGSVGLVKCILYHMRYIPAGAVGGARWQMVVQSRHITDGSMERRKVVTLFKVKKRTCHEVFI